MRSIAYRIRAVWLGMTVVLLSMLVTCPQAASADTGGYPYATYNGPGSDPANFVWTDNSGRAYSQYRYYYRNCTDFVAWKLDTTNGFNPGVSMGHAANWKNWATAPGRNYVVDTNPAVGSVAWWAGSRANSYFGHVAWVEAVSGENVTIQEYNFDLKGNFNRRTIKKNTVSGFIHFKDLQASTPPPNATNDPGRLMFINAQGAAYAKAGLLDAYTRLNDPGNTVSISAGGQYMAIVNACGAAWAKSTLGNQGWIQQTECGMARAVRITSTARVMILNACNAAWAKDGLQWDGWNQLTHCWEAKAIAAAGKFMMIINQCGAAWAKDTLGMAGWVQQNDCGGTYAIAVGSSGRLMIINQCGEAWAKDGLAGYGWAQQTSCGDTRAIAVGGRRLVFINAQGIVYAKDDLLGPYHPMTLKEGATAIAAGSAGRIMIVNQCGEAWAKDTLGMHGWAQQTSCGDARMIAVG